jgi:transcriptional regulator
MYINKHSRHDNPDDTRKFIRENGFGILTSQVGGKPWATHIPMFITDDGLKLTGHIARANKHWKSFESNPDVLAIFSGPHTYISSSWYDHENVPTWNYIAVHVTGKVKIVEEAGLLESLKQMTDKYEKASACPVSVEKMSDDLLKKNIPAIVGFEIVIEKMKATYKLSQNRDDENQRRIIAQLEQRGDADSLKIAQAMKVETRF